METFCITIILYNNFHVLIYFVAYVKKTPRIDSENYLIISKFVYTICINVTFNYLKSPAKKHMFIKKYSKYQVPQLIFRKVKIVK